MIANNRIIVNADYINQHAATYRELLAWMNDIKEADLDTAILITHPDSGVYAFRKPVETGYAFFAGEPIKVETQDWDDFDFVGNLVKDLTEITDEFVTNDDDEEEKKEANDADAR